MNLVFIGLVAGANILTACAANSETAVFTTTDSGFSILKGAVGEHIDVCGYQSESRFYGSKSLHGDHFQLMGGGDLNPVHEDQDCVRGEVVWLGCESMTDITGQSQIICTDATSDFGLRILRVDIR